MPYQSAWIVPDRVWYNRNYGIMTTEEIKEGNVEAASAIRNGVAPVHFVIDTSDLKNFPINLKEMSDSTLFMKEANLGFTIYVTSNMMIRFITQTLTQISKLDFRVVKTLDEGLQLLQILDQTLPPLEKPNLSDETTP
ncbi:MAG: hypothetical protein MUF87_22570 [Anaerolineae bacterium]|jgi:hypothetical protein|nr:hypothetical protein [Anaerolineae bacterium]